MSSPTSRESASGGGARTLYWDLQVETGDMDWTGDPTVVLSWPRHLPLPSTRRDWDALIVPDDCGRAQSAMLAVLNGTDRATVEYRLRFPEGTTIGVGESVFAIRENGRVRQLLGIVTPRVEAEATPSEPSLEQQLQDSTTRFRTFVESLPLLAWEADGNGWIFYYNQPWYRYTGTTPQQMEGWGWVNVHFPPDLPRILKIFRHAIQTGEPWEDEFRLRRADGAYRWHLSRAFPLRDASGRIVRWFGTNTDTHDQHLALQEREQLLAAEQRLRLEAEEQNRQKDEFLAVVSHELRTPLNAVLGWIQIAGDGNTVNVREALTKIERNARFLSRLIEDLLDVSRMVSGKLEIESEAVDLREARDAVVDGVKADAARRGIEIVCTGDTPSIVSGSPSRLRQILNNLLVNAVKFGREHGRIAVDLGGDDTHVVLAVTDDGEGIDPAQITRIFERFTQADTSHRRRHLGLGLGLSIARHLVELHGGTVTAHSDGPGLGATFTVVLPRAEAPVGDAAEAFETNVSLSGLSVLAVDDDAESRDVLTRVLLNAGATVTAVGSVASALEHLRAAVPDVLVSDISMPEIDGYGLVARVRLSTNQAITRLPIIALTAAASVADRRRALDEGFDAFVAKPFRTATLCRVILDCVRQRMIGSR